MIDMATEKLIPLQKARDEIPPGRNGKRTAFSTVLRWVLDGVNTPKGKVRLEAVRLGGRWLTSIQALNRFAAAQTPNLDGEGVEASPDATTARASKANAELEKVGI
jgi:hypothetical protein